MGSFSIWHLLVFAAYIGLIAWPLWRLVKKTGFPPALSICFHIPLLNLLVLWYIAFGDAPNKDSAGF